VPADLITVVDDHGVRGRGPAGEDAEAAGARDRATRGTRADQQDHPEKVHAIVTAGVEAMTRGILFGST
jgi:hypothetical protein